jgi:hypothetical protein
LPRQCKWWSGYRTRSDKARPRKNFLLEENRTVPQIQKGPVLKFKREQSVRKGASTGFSKPSGDLLTAQVCDSGLLGRECPEFFVLAIERSPTTAAGQEASELGARSGVNAD